MKTFKEFVLEEGKLAKTISSVLVGLSLLGMNPAKLHAGEIKDEKQITAKQKKRRDNKFIKALIQVESGGKMDAVGDNGKALGPLQLWKIYIDDVNRIYGTSYKHKDAYDLDKAIDITLKYLAHYGAQYEKNENKQPTAEVFARIHNGGPKGYEKSSTEGYWEKVKNQLKINTKEDQFSKKDN